GVDGRAEEAGGEARDQREADDLPGRVRERQRGEDGGAEQVGDDHQVPALQPVEQRPECQADDDRRQELDEQHRADPDPGVGSVLDVDRERNGGDQRPEARGKRREKEEAEAGDAQRRQLPGWAAGQSRPRVTGSAAHDDTPERTSPSAAAKNSFSSAVPTETLIASGAPKPASGRTITPCS